VAEQAPLLQVVIFAIGLMVSGLNHAAHQIGRYGDPKPKVNYKQKFA